MFTDLMNITIETGDAFLDKKLNSHICYKGGGGGTSTSGLPSWARQYVEGALGGASGAAGRGDFSQVAGFAPEQQQALAGAQGVAEQQADLAGQAEDAVGQLEDVAGGSQDISSQGLRDLATETYNLQAGQEAAAQGPLAGGSARSDRARAFGQARLGTQLADIDYQNQTGNRQTRLGALGQIGSAAGQAQQLAQSPLATLAQAGSARQQQKQREQDASYTGYQRLFGLFSGAPLTENRSTTKGGK